MDKKIICEPIDSIELENVDITSQEYNDILALQEDVLSKVARRENAKHILEELCFLAEKLLHNSVASIMLLDKNTGLVSVLSAPSIPPLGHEALKNLKPGLGGGSCGNAVFRNEPQFVRDTFTDNRWEDLRKVAIDFNICSCWSMPIYDVNNEPIGTFALSSFEHRSPAVFHKKLLATIASIVNIVLTNKDNEKKIALFSTAMQNAVEGIMITDNDNNIIEVNQAFTDMYGYEEKDVLGKNPKMFSSDKHSMPYYKDMWEDIDKNQKWSGEIINKSKDGKYITQWMSISAMLDDTEGVDHYLAIFSDLTEIKETQKKIENMAYYDSLTSLHNKTYLEQIVEDEKDRTLILLNVNNFSYINTAYGFELGDKVLIRVANILKKRCQAFATCRINSDEFALLFNYEVDIKKTIKDIRSYFYGEVIYIDDIALNLSFSYGAVLGNTSLLHSAALALKQAKENGKNNLYIFNKSAENIGSLQRKSFIEANNLLHKALNEDRIVPFFQGIRNNRTKEIIKFEVLARIEGENGKIISPSMFIEPACLAGLLPEITKVIIDKSFKAMAKNSYTFSINISEDDLTKNYLIAYLDKKSLEHGIDTHRVILEILEGMSMKNKVNNINQLNLLKDRGYALAIDDFGSEYSNFGRVLDLDIDFLKIDAKYIKDIHTNAKSYEITKSIVFFAKNVGIPCIAEFIHNEEVQNIVNDLGIDYSQGFYFSKPQSTPI